MQSWILSRFAVAICVATVLGMPIRSEAEGGSDSQNELLARVQRQYLECLQYWFQVSKRVLGFEPPPQPASQKQGDRVVAAILVRRANRALHRHLESPRGVLLVHQDRE